MPFERITSEIQNNIQQVRASIENLYKRMVPASLEDIANIKKELSLIPKIVINFDETLTERDTITYLFEELVKTYPDKALEFDKHRKELKKKYLFTKEQNEQGGDVMETHVEYFYTHVLRGIPKSELMGLYERVLERTSINPNFLRILESLTKEGGYEKIPILGLSINSRHIIEYFYAKHREVFESFNVELIGVIGNEIVFDEDDRVSGVVQHVRNYNKGDYIPEHALTLVDNRDVKNLLLSIPQSKKWRLNIVNIEGGKFNEHILSISVHISRILYKVRNEIQVNDTINQKVQEMMEVNQKLKLDFENGDFGEFEQQLEMLLQITKEIDMILIDYKE